MNKSTLQNQLNEVTLMKVENSTPTKVTEEKELQNQIKECFGETTLKTETFPTPIVKVENEFDGELGGFYEDKEVTTLQAVETIYKPKEDNMNLQIEVTDMYVLEDEHIKCSTECIIVKDNKNGVEIEGDFEGLHLTSKEINLNETETSQLIDFIVEVLSENGLHETLTKSKLTQLAGEL